MVVYSVDRVRHTYACTLPSLLRSAPSPHNLLTVPHLFNDTYVVFSLALIQHNLCHYSRHMFMCCFSHVSPHVTVLIYEQFSESSEKRETWVLSLVVMVSIDIQHLQLI